MRGRGRRGVRQADPLPERGEDGDGVGVEDDAVVAVPVEHHVAQDRDESGVQDLQGVDSEPCVLTGCRRVDQGAGDAEKVAGLDAAQQFVGDPWGSPLVPPAFPSRERGEMQAFAVFS